MPPVGAGSRSCPNLLCGDWPSPALRCCCSFGAGRARRPAEPNIDRRLISFRLITIRSGAFVYQLGHGPLKAERRVRFPYALPNPRRGPLSFVKHSPRMTKRTKPLVGIIMGSHSDWETMQHAATQLTELGVP